MYNIKEMIFSTNDNVMSPINTTAIDLMEQ